MCTTIARDRMRCINWCMCNVIGDSFWGESTTLLMRLLPHKVYKLIWIVVHICSFCLSCCRHKCIGKNKKRPLPIS
jgi:hypothetical protein